MEFVTLELMNSNMRQIACMKGSIQIGNLVLQDSKIHFAIDGNYFLPMDDMILITDKMKELAKYI